MFSLTGKRSEPNICYVHWSPAYRDRYKDISAHASTTSRFGKVTTSHRHSGVSLLVPALATCFWSTRLHIIVLREESHVIRLPIVFKICRGARVQNSWETQQSPIPVYPTYTTEMTLWDVAFQVPAKPSSTFTEHRHKFEGGLSKCIIDYPWVLFYSHGLTSIPRWISNYIHYKVWDENHHWLHRWSLGMDG